LGAGGGGGGVGAGLTGSGAFWTTGAGAGSLFFSFGQHEQPPKDTAKKTTNSTSKNNLFIVNLLIGLSDRKPFFFAASQLARVFDAVNDIFMPISS